MEIAGNTRKATWRRLLRGLFVTARPRQWPKNVFVFAALVFVGELTNLDLLARTATAFILFCAVSSAVYFINDLADIENDRRHPRKRHRPLPAGALSPTAAAVFAVILVGVTLPLSLWLNQGFGLITLAYFGLNLAYTFYLKNLVIIDVMVVAAGFVLRAVAGAEVIQVPISPWLYVCTILLALYISFVKRRHELVLLENDASQHRQILDDYSVRLLDELNTIVASTTIVAYSLYTFSAPNLPANHSMMLTIPFVLYGIFRYMYLTHRKNEGGSPEDILFKDKPFLANIILWGLAVVIVLYVL
jgi:4-hydroxybenzoate polyprenyltransferase